MGASGLIPEPCDKCNSATSFAKFRFDTPAGPLYFCGHHGALYMAVAFVHGYHIEELSQRVHAHSE